MNASGLILQLTPWNWSYLQEADEVAEHQFVDVRQAQHNIDGGLWVVIVTDTLLIKLVRDERLLQLPVPELQQGRWGHAEVRQS